MNRRGRKGRIEEEEEKEEEIEEKEKKKKRELADHKRCGADSRDLRVSLEERRASAFSKRDSEIEGHEQRMNGQTSPISKPNRRANLDT